MRIKLALYFMCLVLVLHFIGAALSITLFHISLEKNTDTLLTDLLAEVRPSIQITKNHIPTLITWATNADDRELKHGATIQVFDTKGNILENYGPEGINKLANGKLSQNRISIQSRHEKINHGNHTYGYVQIQTSTEQNDTSTQHAIYAALLAAPFIGALVSIVGYMFAGIAIEPVNKTMQLLRRFVADAGHELNTPIAIIEASIETLQEVLREHKISEDLTEVISKASARMNELASDLVFLARVEDPVSHYPISPINIKEIVDEVVTNFRPLAKIKNIELCLEQIPNLEIQGNAEFLKRMLSNLISNAMRFTDADGTVSINIFVDGKRLHIQIKDTGIGITSDNIEKIFDRFYRADNARNRASGGAGLGLSIVKAVVEAHKGNISVTSAIAKGSTFTVAIPL